MCPIISRKRCRLRLKLFLLIWSLHSQNGKASFVSHRPSFGPYSADKYVRAKWFVSRGEKVRDIETLLNGGGSKKMEAIKKKRTKEKEKTDTPLYWQTDEDEFELFDQGAVNVSTTTSSSIETSDKMIRFTVRGKPVPLRRHRTSRGFIYNPSAKKQKAFRDVVSEMLPSLYLPLDNATSAGLLFQEEEFLRMSIIFHLPRPKRHFVGSKPGPGRMRPSSPGYLHSTRSDVDNLAKFVLDSLNKLLYNDDRQVVSLHVVKILDSKGNCDGATEILIQSFQEADVENLLFRMMK